MNPYAPPATQPSSSTNSRQASVPIAGLEGRVLVRERGIFTRPGFVVDGAFKPAARGFVEIADPTGRLYRLRLRGFPLDPCPRIEVDGAVVDVFPRLPNWVTVACCLPLALLGIGGFVGGILGISATYGNFRIARASSPVVVRLAAGALMTVVAYAVMTGVRAGLRALVR